MTDFCPALIADNAVAKVDLSGDSGFNEQLYGAVDGGVGHLQLSCMHDKKKLINIKPAIEINELLENDAALLAGFDSSSGQIFSENFFRILYHEKSLSRRAPSGTANYNDNHFQGHVNMIAVAITGFPVAALCQNKVSTMKANPAYPIWLAY